MLTTKIEHNLLYIREWSEAPDIDRHNRLRAETGEVRQYVCYFLSPDLRLLTYPVASRYTNIYSYKYIRGCRQVILLNGVINIIIFHIPVRIYSYVEFYIARFVVTRPRDFVTRRRIGDTLS